MVLSRLVLHVTYECPYRCAYCETHAVREYMHESVADFRELNNSEIKLLLSQAREYGVPYVVLSGGEPFHRDDIYDVIDHCGCIRLPLIINTRHTFAPEEVDKIKAAAAFLQLWVSIDSPDPATAAELSGRGGWLEDYVDGIRLLLASGVTLTSISVVNRRNVRQLDDLFALLADLSMPKVFLHEVSLPTCCAAEYPRSDQQRGMELLLSDEDRAVARDAEKRWSDRLNFIASLSDEGAEGGSGFVPRSPAGDTMRADDLPRICSILNGEMIVRPDGKVIYCGLAQDIVVGDLRRTSLAEVAGSAALNRMCNPTRRDFAGTDCHDCSSFHVCTRLGRCYKRTLKFNGECLTPDRKLCERFLGIPWQVKSLGDELARSTR